MTTRGLEPAGVDLQAKGFKEYIANLERIEKQQREVFDREFKGTGQSFAQVQKAARDYQGQLKSLEKQYNQAVAQEQKFRNAQDQTRAGVGALTKALSAAAVVTFGKQLVRSAADAAQAAAAFQGQEQGLQNLAGNYGQSATAIRDAMRRASQGVLSETAIINGANQSLLLNVARTPEQFEEITRTSLILGRTLGLTATQSIDQFNIALGRKSLLILDNFGISARSVNQEIERLAQQKFGEAARSLSQAQRDSLFLEAALKVAGQAADALGDEVLESTRNFDKINAQAENLKIVLGEIVLGMDSTTGASRSFGNALEAIVGNLRGLKVDLGFGDIGDEVAALETQIRGLEKARDQIAEGGAPLTTRFLELIGVVDTTEDVENLNEKIGELRDELNRLNIQKRREEIKNTNKSIEDFTDSLEDNTEQVKALEAVLRQAEQLELSFARAAEDAARRLGRQQAKLARDQFKDRVDLLNNQAKEFDQFQQDELESVQEAEAELNEAREKAGKERLREQDKLHRELKQARDRFNLDALQSQRRFDLQDRRLRAAGDILALQELREDFSLQQQEAKENFDLQNSQRKEDAKDQTDVADERRQEQVAELEQELTDLQDGLDQRRQEFLAAQQEEFNNLLTAQAEQQLAARQAQLEQEEDRRISQQRQIEDLGRSLAEQEDLTEEGALAIAQQLEKAFGIDGAADQIMSGFTARQESAFRGLFETIQDTIEKSEKAIAESSLGGSIEFGATALGGLGEGLVPQQVPSFHEGGVVPGPRGSEQTIRALGGETVLPTHQMNAPLIPSQNLNVNMSGGFNISGGEGAGQAATQAAIIEMTEAFEIAVKRLGRRI